MFIGFSRTESKSAYERIVFTIMGPTLIVRAHPVYMYMYMQINLECIHCIKMFRARLVYTTLKTRVFHRFKKLTRVAAPSPRASLGRRTVCGRTEQL